MRSAALMLAAAVAPVALAFRDSSPFLIYSSEPNPSLKEAQAELTSGVISSSEIYATISSLGCDWETLVVGHVEDMHQSRLDALRLPSVQADLHIPYLLRPDRASLDDAIEDWAKICGAEVRDSFGAGKGVHQLNVKDGQDIFETVASAPTPYLVILTGTPSLAKRQEAPLPPSQSSSSARQSSTASRPSSTSTGSPRNETLPTGPLLERVQLLTVPVITGLLVTFLLFIPILYVGIGALAGIQVPPRMLEIGKGLQVGKDRKDQ